MLDSTAGKAHRSVLRLACLVAACLLLATEAAARPESFELVPGVVVDEARETLYLMTPAGAVEKLSVPSGNSLWTSTEAAKPLALHGSQVIAQVAGSGPSGGLEIALLDAADGSSLGQPLKTILPPGVRSSIDDGLGVDFDVRAEIRGNEPHVTWVETRRYSKGVAPPPGTELERKQTAVYRLDSRSRRLVAVEAAPPANASGLPVGVRRAAATEAFSEPPRAAGEVVAATQVIGAMVSPSPSIVLKRWQRPSGTALPDVELFRGPHILQYRSADGLHLLITERIAPGDSQEYEWSVFSLESGELIGRLRHHRSHGHFFVQDSAIVFEEPPYSHLVDGELVEEPRRLRAAVLGSGVTIWDRALRDTAYRGPFPP